MKTDDFLADLERQLASARPRRRPPAASWLAVPAVAAILALAFLAGGDPDTEREARPANTDSAVMVENRTGDPAVGAQAGEELKAAGYDVTVRDLPGVPETAIFAPEADAQRIADALGLEAPESALGWTAYAPLDTDGPMRVVLGKNELGAGTEPIIVLDASGSPRAARDAQERLESTGGLIVGGSGGPLPPQKTQVLGVDATDDEVAERVRDFLGLPDASPQHASQEFLDRWIGGSPASVVVIVGTDYGPPLPPAIAPEVLVRNGSSKDENEAEAGRRLREAGFEVAIQAGDLDPRERSQVDYSGEHLARAEAVADALGIERIVRAYGADLPEVVVTLGDDFGP